MGQTCLAFRPAESGSIPMQALKAPIAPHRSRGASYIFAGTTIISLMVLP